MLVIPSCEAVPMVPPVHYAGSPAFYCLDMQQDLIKLAGAETVKPLKRPF